MRKFWIGIFALCQTVLIAAAQAAPVKEAVTTTECMVVRIAERYLAVHFPEFDSFKNPPYVQDKGDSWVVQYRLPKGVIGGTPVVVIDKNSLEVVRSYHTQ